MKTSSGTSSASTYATQMAASTGSTGSATVAPAPDDPTASFEDLLQQQETTSPLTPPVGATDWQGIIAKLSGNTPDTTAAVATTPTGSTSPDAPSAPAPTLPVLKDFLPKGNPLAPAPTETATSTLAAPMPAKSLPASLYTGSSIFEAHSAILAAQARQVPAAQNQGASVTETETDSTLETTTAASTTLADAFGLGLTLPKLSGKTTGASTTEKKSDASSSQGSFLQSDAAPVTTPWMLLGAASQSLATNVQASVSQTFANHSVSAGNAVEAASVDATGVAGMANGKKEKEMNATLDLTDLVVSTGTNATVMKNPADVNILLGSNQDFKDALGQVMRVAELSGMSNTTPPLRVAIEIQTPPGAIVNVYVSRQDDGYRAQLSANDPQALSWVQDQIGSLRQSTDTGVSVRWLPAQLESSSSSSLSTSSSGSESNLSWDRGGQGQQGNPQPDERQQGSRQKRPLFAGLLSPVHSNTFMEAVGAFGRAA